MKKHTLYWVVTGLFAAFMIFSAVSNVMMSPEAVLLITGLGYPKYFIPFIGMAKIAGSIVVLIPGLKRLKEWAYAGLFFDLAGAFFSIVARGLFEPMVLTLLLPIGFLFWSYFLWHKKLAVTNS
ncbi:MAG: DoxX family protein [Bacteroidetes bacterium]|nr:DoxX family protein [Bacteroidota bacterium]